MSEPRTKREHYIEPEPTSAYKDKGAGGNLENPKKEIIWAARQQALQGREKEEVHRPTVNKTFDVEIHLFRDTLQVRTNAPPPQPPEVGWCCLRARRSPKTLNPKTLNPITLNPKP